MPSETVDYTVAALMLVLLFTVSMEVLAQMTSPMMNYMYVRSCTTIASSTLDSILLSPGSPPGWGFSPVSVSAFGLARINASEYNLDPWSPMRIMAPRTVINGTYNAITPVVITQRSVYLKYGDASALLGIRGKFGFQLKMRPALNISVVPQSGGGPQTFTVAVQGGTGFVPNAVVNATLCYTLGGDPPTMYSSSAGNVTDSTGHAQLSFSPPSPPLSYSLLVRARIGVVRSAYTYMPPESSPKVYVSLLDSPNVREVTIYHHDVIVGPPTGGVIRYNVTKANPSPGGGYTFEWIASGSLGGIIASRSVIIPDIASSILLIAVQDEATGATSTYVVPWGLSASGLSVTYGESPIRQESVILLHRIVTVEDDTYVVSMSFWSTESRPVFAATGGVSGG